jgi:hypothetical protein
MVCGQRSSVDISTLDKCWLLRLEHPAFMMVSEKFPQFVSFIESLASAQDPRAEEGQAGDGMTRKINLPIF